VSIDRSSFADNRGSAAVVDNVAGSVSTVESDFEQNDVDNAIGNVNEPPPSCPD
jgi:hypothetical protein